MSYEVKFEAVRIKLIQYCLDCVKENWDRMFDMWLSSDADLEFGDAYKNKFREEFSDYMNPETEKTLWLAAKNIVFAINGFMAYKNDANLHDLLDFTENFITAQLDDFGNWCDDILMAMPDETETKEDNPS